MQEKGSKRVMLRNAKEANFRKTLVLISRVLFLAGDQRHVSFEAFFTHVLAHELVHGLGPHHITAGGEQTTVRKRLKESYSAIEEAKAGVTGLRRARGVGRRFLAEVLDQHEVEIELVALRVDNGVLVGRDREAGDDEDAARALERRNGRRLARSEVEEL